jgi:hypothetical protein
MIFGSEKRTSNLHAVCGFGAMFSFKSYQLVLATQPTNSHYGLTLHLESIAVMIFATTHRFLVQICITS